MSALAKARQLSTRAVVARWQAQARLRGLTLHARVHPLARIDAGVHLEVHRGPSPVITLDVGPHAHLAAGALLRLTGGAQVLIGEHTLVRRFAVLNVAGRLRLAGHNLVSFHSVVHAAGEVVLEELAGTGDAVTVVDGTHYRRAPGDHWYHNSHTAPVHIGRNVWLASHSTVAAGVSIGEDTTVAAGSVVTADLPAGCLAGGMPARVLRSHADVLGER